MAKMHDIPPVETPYGVIGLERPEAAMTRPPRRRRRRQPTPEADAAETAAAPTEASSDETPSAPPKSEAPVPENEAAPAAIDWIIHGSISRIGRSR